MLKLFYNFFLKKNKTTTKNKPIHSFGISKELNTQEFSSAYKNITEAIQATNGYEYFIFEIYDDSVTCKGMWKDYILQK